MIESAIQTALVGDTELVSLLSEYRGAVSIFSSMGPETVEHPYITYHIDTNSTPGRVVNGFTVRVNVWDRSTSRVIARRIVERVIFTLDQARLTSDRYDTIRVQFENAGPVDSEEGGEDITNDPRHIQYALVFSARAGRKKWSSTQ